MTKYTLEELRTKECSTCKYYHEGGYCANHDHYLNHVSCVCIEYKERET